MWRAKSLEGPETFGDDVPMRDLREKRENIIDELSRLVSERPQDEVRIQVLPSVIILM
jgi:hypothetical protein